MKPSFQDYLTRIGAHTNINQASEVCKRLMMLGLYLQYYETVHNIIVAAFNRGYVVHSFQTGTLVEIINKDFTEAKHLVDRYSEAFADVQKHLKENEQRNSAIPF
jgi:hypothetical protein